MWNRRIIVGVDLDGDDQIVTPGSRRAAIEAERLARERSATVEFLHSTYFDHVYTGDTGSNGWESPPISLAGRTALGRLVRECCAGGTPCELVLVELPPVVALCRAAKRPGTELIVVGRHNGIENGSRLGSVCERLLQCYPAPLWIVTPHAPVHV